jgi:hypothetical protein
MPAADFGIAFATTILICLFVVGLYYMALRCFVSRDPDGTSIGAVVHRQDRPERGLRANGNSGHAL